MYADTTVTVDGVTYSADGSGALTQVQQPDTQTEAAQPGSQESGTQQNQESSAAPGPAIIEGVNGGPGVTG